MPLRPARPWSVVLLLVASVAPAAAQRAAEPGLVSPETEHALRRYRDQRLSDAYHDDSHRVPVLPFGPRAPEPPRKPSRRDAHAGLAGFPARSCESCHEGFAQNSHSTRGNNTCRQCHGTDPISTRDHYFSPMNPIRRHAYVCAKCHDGASASFATYVVHVPEVGPKLLASFPALYWADRFMFWLIAGVLIVFLPHGVAWWIREWFVRRRGAT